MSNLQGDYLSKKLSKLFKESFELNCSKLINWNFYQDQTNTLKGLFIGEFSKYFPTRHEITKNLFKDFIMKSSSDFAEELWNTKLKNTEVGKMYFNEIQKMFEIKRMYIKTETPSGDQICTVRNYNTNNDVHNQMKSPFALSQKNDINLLKKQLESKLNSEKVKELENMNDDDDDDYNSTAPRSQSMRTTTFSTVRLAIPKSFIDVTQIDEILDEEQASIDSEQQKQITNEDDNQKHKMNRIKRKRYSLSLPNPKVLNNLDYMEENLYEHILSNINMKTSLLLELSNKKNETNMKIMKNQFKLKYDIFIKEDDKEGENIIYQSATNKTIVYMTINLLLNKIALDNFAEKNPSLIKGFIQQCSAFISIDNLIHKIISAYNWLNHSKHPNVNNLITFMNELIQHEAPFNTSTFRGFNIVLSFYKELSKNESLKSPANTTIKDVYTLLKKMNSKSDKYGYNYNNDSLPPNEHSMPPTTSQPGKYFYMFFHDAWDIANELTRITFNLFSDIKVKELLRAKFGKDKKKETSPNIVRSVERFDNLIYFIIEDILAYDRPRCRAQLIEKWIDVAWQCRELGNYNDCLIITITFCNYLMRNLKKSWDRVGSDHMKKLSELKALCSFQNVYEKIKKETNEKRQTGQRFVPYLGLLLKEITSLEEKFQYVKDDTLINFMKIEKVQNAIDAFFMFKNIPYKIKECNELKILEFLRPKTQDDLEKETKMLEPEFKYGKKNMYGKRQTRTDKFYYENFLEETEDELGMGKKTRLDNYA